MSAAERLLYFFGRPLVRCFYRVTPLGLENLPDGGFLLVPNHISWVDALILQLTCPRPIRYVIDQEYYHKRMLHPILARDRLHPHQQAPVACCSSRRCGKIAEGEIVCVFPEGELERRGTLLRLQRGYEVIARHAKAEVVPVWLDQLWGSIFSFQGGKFFRKFPKRIRYLCYGRLWKTTRGKSSRRRDRARGVAQAGRILFQPPAVIGSASCRRLRARFEAQTLRHSSDRWNRSYAA